MYINYVYHIYNSNSNPRKWLINNFSKTTIGELKLFFSKVAFIRNYNVSNIIIMEKNSNISYNDDITLEFINKIEFDVKLINVETLEPLYLEPLYSKNQKKRLILY